MAIALHPKGRAANTGIGPRPCEGPREPGHPRPGTTSLLAAAPRKWLRAASERRRDTAHPGALPTCVCLGPPLASPPSLCAGAVVTPRCADRPALRLLPGGGMGARLTAGRLRSWETRPGRLRGRTARTCAVEVGLHTHRGLTRDPRRGSLGRCSRTCPAREEPVEWTGRPAGMVMARLIVLCGCETGAPS